MPVSVRRWTSLPLLVSDMTDRITHIEVRRVQNGYIVAVFDMSIDTSMHYNRPQVGSYVATSAQELGALIESLATATEIDWLPSTELQMMDYHRACAKKESPG